MTTDSQRKVLYQVREGEYKYTITSYSLRGGGLCYRIIICPKLFEQKYLKYNKYFLPIALTKLHNKKRKVYNKLKTFITLTNIPLENI